MTGNIQNYCRRTDSVMHVMLKYRHAYFQSILVKATTQQETESVSLYCFHDKHLEACDRLQPSKLDRHVVSRADEFPGGNPRFESG